MLKDWLLFCKSSFEESSDLLPSLPLKVAHKLCFRSLGFFICFAKFGLLKVAQRLGLSTVLLGLAFEVRSQIGVFVLMSLFQLFYWIWPSDSYPKENESLRKSLRKSLKEFSKDVSRGVSMRLSKEFFRTSLTKSLQDSLKDVSKGLSTSESI